MLRMSPAILALAMLYPPRARTSQLLVIQFPSDTSAFNVSSVVIGSPTEALIVDAQYHMGDARREADRIAQTGTHVKAIFITHPDEDHYMGAAAFVERFPGTPVYMTAAAIEEFKRTSDRFLKSLRAQEPKEAPDSLISPQVLPNNIITIEGDTVEIIPDEQGDVLRPTNSFLWIPSIRTVITGDIVFNGVYPWLGSSDAASRQRWHRSIQKIAALHPVTVIASHKKAPDTPDTPDALRAMDQYLTDFDAARATSPNAQALVAVMKQKYPDYAIPKLLEYSAQIAYRNTGA